VLIDRMQQLRDWANNRKEDKLQLFYDMLRSANSQGVYFVLTAFDRGELPIKYHSYIHGVALQLSERISYADALAARIPAEWGGIRSYAGRGLIAREDKEEKQTYIYEIQTAVYGTGESDSRRAEMIGELGREMCAAWSGKLPRGIARIPAEPKLREFLAHEDMRGQMALADRLPMYYAKDTGEMKCLNLREMFSMLICGPRKSGKTNLLENIGSAFAEKGGCVHVIGSSDLAEWAKAHGMNGYVHGDDAWKTAFNKTVLKEVSVRSNLLMEAKTRGGMKARNALLTAFTPVVVLIDDLDAYIEKYDAIPEMSTYLTHFTADNVSGYGIYLYASISHAGYQRMRIKQPLVGMAAAKRGVMLQGRLSECDPFDVQVPFATKNLALPLGEGWLVADGGAERIVIPKWNEE